MSAEMREPEVSESAHVAPRPDTKRLRFITALVILGTLPFSAPALIPLSNAEPAIYILLALLWALPLGSVAILFTNPSRPADHVLLITGLVDLLLALLAVVTAVGGLVYSFIAAESDPSGLAALLCFLIAVMGVGVFIATAVPGFLLVKCWRASSPDRMPGASRSDATQWILLGAALLIVVIPVLFWFVGASAKLTAGG